MACQDPIAPQARAIGLLAVGIEEDLLDVRAKFRRREDFRQVVNEMRAADLVDPRDLLLPWTRENECGRPQDRSAPDR